MTSGTGLFSRRTREAVKRAARAVCEALERRQLLDGAGGDVTVDDLAVITSRDQVVSLNAPMMGPIQFIAGGDPAEEVILSDHKRLVIGDAGGDIVLMQRNADSTPDQAFGAGGTLTVDFGSSSDRALNLSLRDDGGIVVMGLADAAESGKTQFVFARYNAAGVLDTTFGENGILLTGIGRSPGFGIVSTVLSDGRLHATGLGDGAIVGMEYDASGHNGWDRLAGVDGSLSPASLNGAIISPQPGTLAYYANSPFVGPVAPVSNPLTLDSLTVINEGESHTLTLPDGQSRTVDWGDGQFDSVGDEESEIDHTYDLAGSYTISVTGYFESIAPGTSFSETGSVIRTKALTLSGSETVTLGANDLILEYGTGATPFATLKAQVINGEQSNLPSIISAGGSSEPTILSLIDNEGLGTNRYTEWPSASGHSIGALTVIGKYTYFGDVNWDGTVTGDDYSPIDLNLSTTPDARISWLKGDANWDGTVTGDDYPLVDTNLNRGTVARGESALDGSKDAILRNPPDEVQVTALPTPTAPTNLAATNITPSSLTLTWADNSTSETDNELYISEDGGITFELLEAIGAHTGSTITYNVSDLTADSAYVFKVVAKAGSSVSAPAYCAPRTVQTIAIANGGFESPVLNDGQNAALSTPWTLLGPGTARIYNFAGITAPEGNNLLNMTSWTAEDLDAVQTLSDTLRASTVYTLTAWVRSDLVPGTDIDLVLTAGGSSFATPSYSASSPVGFFKKVTATYTSPSDPSNLGEALAVALRVKTPDYPRYFDDVQLTSQPVSGLLSVPTGVSAAGVPSDEDTAIEIWWDSDFTTDSWTIRRSDSPSFTESIEFVAEGDQSSYTDTSLENASVGTTFYYQVKKNAGTGSSAWSEYVSATVPRTLPTTPSGLYAVAKPDDTVQLSWYPSGSVATTYRVQRSTDQEFTENVTNVDPPAGANVELASTRNVVSVNHSSVMETSGDLILRGWWSDDLSVFIGEGDFITVFDNGEQTTPRFTVTIPDNAILINNSPPAGDNYWGTGAGTVRLQNLSETKIYDILSNTQVQQFESVGFDTRDASEGVTDAELRSRGWVGDDGVARYKIGIVGDTATLTTTVSSSRQIYNDSPPAQGTYFYRVKAITGTVPDTLESRSWSNLYDVITPGAAPNAASEALVRTISDTERALDWTDNSGNETGFAIFRANNPWFTQGVVYLATVDRDVTSFIDRTAQAGIQYYYRVHAVNHFVTRSASQAVSAAASAAPAEIKILKPSTWDFGRPAPPSRAQTPSEQFTSAIPVHVRASENTLTAYNPLSYRYTWSFHDGGSGGGKYNVLHGWNAAHVYRNKTTTLRRRTITLTIDDPQTGSPVASTTISVFIKPEAPTTQIRIANLVNGVQPSDTVSLTEGLQRLKLAEGKKDVELLFAQGQQFDLTQSVLDQVYGVGAQAKSIDLKGYQNTIVSSFQLAGGGTSKPVLRHIIQGSGNGSTHFVTVGRDVSDSTKTSRGIAIRGLRFTSPFGPETDVPNNGGWVIYAPRIINLEATNLLVQDCELGEVDGMVGTSNTYGLLLQQNVTVQAHHGYFLLTGGQPSFIVALGNVDSHGSLRESSFRLAWPTSYALVYGNALKESGKSPLRLIGRLYLYAERNTLDGDGNWIGPLPDGDGSDFASGAVVAFDSNVVMRGSTRINPGLYRAVIRNNIFKGSSQLYIRGEPRRDVEQVGGIARDIWVVNNTRVDDTGNPLLYFQALKGDSAMRFRNIHVANNLTAISSLQKSPALKAVVLDELQPPFGSTKLLWSNQLSGVNDGTRWWSATNVWPSGARFGIDSQIQSTNKSVAEWNAYWEAFNSSGYNDAEVATSNLVVDAGYRPVAPNNSLNIGQRLIYGPEQYPSPVGAQALQVAAWDYNLQHRRSTHVTAGAVQIPWYE